MMVTERSSHLGIELTLWEKPPPPGIELTLWPFCHTKSSLFSLLTLEAGKHVELYEPNR